MIKLLFMAFGLDLLMQAHSRKQLSALTLESRNNRSGEYKKDTL